MAINPGRAGAQLSHHFQSARGIAGPDRRRHSVRRIIGQCDGLAYVFERQTSDDRAENFLPYNFVILLHISQHGWWKEKNPALLAERRRLVP
jgi:hypothetical protein